MNKDKPFSLLIDGATSMLLLFLGVATLLFATIAAVALFFPYPLDYGEAPLIDQARRLIAGQNIYRHDISSPPYTISNYPPLYLLALAPFVALFSPSFLAGRAISVLSAAAAATFLALIIHKRTNDRLAAIVTGLLFLAIPYVTFWSSLLRIDLLALAFSTGALFFLIYYPITGRNVAVVSLLLVAAIYTRQAYALAAPLAAFAWLWRHDRRHAFSLAATTGGISLILFAGLNLLTGGGFFFNVVTANVNEFNWEHLTWNLQRLRETAPVLLILAGLYLVGAWRRNKSWWLLGPYLAGAALASLTVGKIGSNVNYFLELAAALSLVAGALFAWSRPRTWLHLAFLLLLVGQIGWLVRTTLDEFVDPLAMRLSQRPDLEQLEIMVAQAGGPILADEYMGLITLQGRPLYIQPFEVTQLAHAGLWNQEAFLERIRDQEFAVVLIYHMPSYPLHEERWTPEMLFSISRHYRLSQIWADTYVYLPRGPRTSVALPSWRAD